jgi:hypothetical protein
VLLYSKQINVSDHCTAQSLLIKFLDRVPENRGYKAITKLQIDGINSLSDRTRRPFYTTFGLRLFHECSGLQHLSIGVYAMSFIKYTIVRRNGSSWRVSEAEVLEKFEMNHLFELLNLKSFVLEFIDGDHYASRSSCTTTTIFEHLTTWLRDEHLRRHAKFSLQIKYGPRKGTRAEAELLGWGPQEGTE